MPNPRQITRDFKVSTLNSCDLFFSSPIFFPSSWPTYPAVSWSSTSGYPTRISDSTFPKHDCSLLLPYPEPKHSECPLLFVSGTSNKQIRTFFFPFVKSSDLGKCDYPIVPTKTQVPVFWRETHSTLAKQRFPFSHGLRSSEKCSQPMKPSEAEATFILSVNYSYPVSFIFRLVSSVTCMFQPR